MNALTSVGPFPEYFFQDVGKVSFDVRFARSLILGRDIEYLRVL